MEREPFSEEPSPEKARLLEDHQKMADFLNLSDRLREGGEEAIIEAIADGKTEEDRAKALGFLTKRIEALSVSGDKKDLEEAKSIYRRFTSEFFGS